jgi:hypothetical protein
VVAAEARLAAAAEDMGEAGRTVAQAGAARVRAIHRTSNGSSLPLPHDLGAVRLLFKSDAVSSDGQLLSVH